MNNSCGAKVFCYFLFEMIPWKVFLSWIGFAVLPALQSYCRIIESISPIIERFSCIIERCSRLIETFSRLIENCSLFIESCSRFIEILSYFIESFSHIIENCYCRVNIYLIFNGFWVLTQFLTLLSANFVVLFGEPFIAVTGDEVVNFFKFYFF